MRFWDNLHQVRTQSKRWKAKIIKKKVLRASKTKDLNRIDKIGYDHL